MAVIDTFHHSKTGVPEIMRLNKREGIIYVMLVASIMLGIGNLVVVIDFPRYNVTNISQKLVTVKNGTFYTSTFWDFESGNLSGWTLGRGGRIPSITSSFSYAGNRSVRFNSSGQSYMWLPGFCPDLAGFSCWLYVTDPSLFFVVFILYKTPDGLEVVRAMFSMVDGMVNNAWKYSANQWFNLKLVDNQDGTCGYYMNGVLLLTAAYNSTTAGIMNPSNSASIEVPGSGYGTLYSDDIVAISQW